MKQTELIMGMPITVEIVAAKNDRLTKEIFDYFHRIDERFSTYKPTSEISRINNKKLPKAKWSNEMKSVIKLCQQTKQQTDGYFNIEHGGRLDPSGLVKGWGVHNAAQKLLQRGVINFYIEAGGDIEAHGVNEDNEPWRVGIRNPFDLQEIIKVLAISGQGIATSGTYIRGQHIYNPHQPNLKIIETKSLTVIGSDIYEADRFATAAFAMGKSGINFIEKLDGFEGYMVDDKHKATFTSGFEKYVYA